jgi:hypothetical protein
MNLGCVKRTAAAGVKSSVDTYREATPLRSPPLASAGRMSVLTVHASEGYAVRPTGTVPRMSCSTYWPAR